ncbi:MAG: undecaprenyldiphospho-muramoylpentapeptide beta-N-acetylglucosaminyltransferase [Coriobacteriales bacterium]|jgi:UDP-N-acetylglucosamine--N-acetylmuramyl-(pentapeptide) pyrophosphoryl-undecaprenol N-acetylglucosamine transferase|nr:undecaprenyldiphospho-muramoylpentapeptide beta-N-acetylglucosaminyltransferase [Coriobacteriales bacterium]
MHIVIAAGGTGGHIYPALAVAQVARGCGNQISFAGGLQGPEAQLAESHGLDFRGFDVQGFDRSRPTSLLSATRKMLHATRLAKDWLRQIGATAVCTFGGYACLGVGRAALQIGLPLLVHEQNSYPGITNRDLAKKAQAIALTYQDALSHMQPKADALVEVTGNPVRQEFLDSVSAYTAKVTSGELASEHDGRHLLVFGGSQGARHLNQAVIALRDRLQDVALTLVTGPGEFERAQAALEEQGGQPESWQLLPYCDHMPEAMLTADLALCRAGAGTLAELAVCKLPAILVPYPYATADHQTANARALTEGGACDFIADADLGSEAFSEKLFGLIQHQDRLKQMRRAYRDFVAGNAAQNVYDLLVRIVK